MISPESGSILHRIRDEVGAFLIDLGHSTLGYKSDLTPPTREIFVGIGDYKAIGFEYLRYFIEYAGLKRDDIVLDMGCGIGRMARPLTRYLDKGEYFGIDVAEKGIAWCNDNYRERFPRFRFIHAPIYNKTYNPRGTIKASEYVFPFPDNTFDIVIYTSVFTHMLPSDTSRYLSESARVLKPGGRMFSTWFLLNEQTKQLMQDKAAKVKLHYPLEGSSVCLCTNPKYPEAAIGYEESHIRTSLSSLGLSKNMVVKYGRWSGYSPYVTLQDIVVSEKS